MIRVGDTWWGTVPETCATLGIRPHTIYDWRRRKGLRTVTIRGILHVDRSHAAELEAAIRGNPKRRGRTLVCV